MQRKQRVREREREKKRRDRGRRKQHECKACNVSPHLTCISLFCLSLLVVFGLVCCSTQKSCFHCNFRGLLLAFPVFLFSLFMFCVVWFMTYLFLLFALVLMKCFYLRGGGPTTPFPPTEVDCSVCLACSCPCLLLKLAWLLHVFAYKSTRHDLLFLVAILVLLLVLLLFTTSFGFENRFLFWKLTLSARQSQRFCAGKLGALGSAAPSVFLQMPFLQDFGASLEQSLAS